MSSGMVERITSDVFRQLNPQERKSVFNQPDIFDIVTFISIVAFFIITFLPAPLLGSTVEAERILASKFITFGVFGIAGLGLREVFNNMPVRNSSGDIIKTSVTKRIYESKNWTGLKLDFIYFGLAFSVHLIFSFVVLRLTPLSIFHLNAQVAALGFVAAVAEELFFAYLMTGLGAQKLKWGIVPVIAILFAGYHWWVYHSLASFIYVGIMRVVYSIIYLLSRRLSSVILAHALNNLLVALGV